LSEGREKESLAQHARYAWALRKREEEIPPPVPIPISDGEGEKKKKRNGQTSRSRGSRERDRHLPIMLCVRDHHKKSKKIMTNLFLEEKKGRSSGSLPEPSVVKETESALASEEKEGNLSEGEGGPTSVS